MSNEIVANAFFVCYNTLMIKIWAKIYSDNKIIRQCVFERAEKMDYSLFFEYLSEICSTLDIPTPVIIKTHIFNYAKFNHVKFLPADFIENVDFDKLILENIF